MAVCMMDEWTEEERRKRRSRSGFPLSSPVAFIIGRARIDRIDGELERDA